MSHWICLLVLPSICHSDCAGQLWLVYLSPIHLAAMPHLREGGLIMALLQENTMLPSYVTGS